MPVNSEPTTTLPAAPSPHRLEQLCRAVAVAKKRKQGMGDAAIARDLKISQTAVRNLRMLGAMYLEASPEVRYFMEVAPRFAGSVVNSLSIATQTRLWTLPANEILHAVKAAIITSNQEGSPHSANYLKGRVEWVRLSRGIGDARLSMALDWLDRCEAGEAVPLLQETD